MMQNTSSSYLPIPPELATSGLLVPIKLAASHHGCSADTLKNNTKARNLRAFQQFFGAPVLVLLSDVEAFLKARPDITSAFYPKTPPVGQLAYGMGGGDPPAPWMAGASEAHPYPIQVPEMAAKSSVSVDVSDGNAGFLQLKSLSSATPAERSMVIKVLLEIFVLINRPASPSPQFKSNEL